MKVEYRDVCGLSRARLGKRNSFARWRLQRRQGVPFSGDRRGRGGQRGEKIRSIPHRIRAAPGSENVRLIIRGYARAFT